MSDSIAIVGGGIGGLATAHHLSRAGVRNITVYEASDMVGGKARSQYPSDAQGRLYPGEHGFRFFPHFYRHLLETLRQIPTASGTVRDRLVGPRVGAIAYNGDIFDVDRPVEIGPNLSFVRTTIEILMRPEISAREATRFAGRLLQFASSCEERRKSEYDSISWAKFTGAEDRPYSRAFEDVVIRASQNLSAMRAKDSSASTIGAITLQLLFTSSPDEHADALLCSPTDEAWLADWKAHLEAQGVSFRFGARLASIDFDPLGGRIERLHFADQASPVTADHYVCAIPLERLVAVLSEEMMEFDPALAQLPPLASSALGNMTGLQFFLNRSVPIKEGHIHYPGTPFALTSISQGQFWSPTPAARPDAPPSLRDVLSVIISDWETPGSEGKGAREYASREELAREVWRQMKSALPTGTLRDADIIATHVDANVRLAPFVNETPLLIHPRGQYRRRPDAESAIQNLCLASDFVRTNTDLATMEGADEAARRSARCILQRLGVATGKWPAIYALEEGAMFDSAKDVDRRMFKLGLPHWMQPAAPKLKPPSSKAFEALADTAAKGLHQLSELRKKLPHLDDDELSTDALEKWEKFLRR